MGQCQDSQDLTIKSHRKYFCFNDFSLNQSQESASNNPNNNNSEKNTNKVSQNSAYGLQSYSGEDPQTQQQMQENEDLNMNNMEIVENVEGMVKMIRMVYSQASRSLKIIGDFSDSNFMEDHVTVIKLHEVSELVAELLEKGIVCLEKEKPVEGLFNFKKAEEIVNY